MANRIDRSVSSRYEDSYNDLASMGYMLVGVRQSWDGLYDMNMHPVPSTVEGELPSHPDWQQSSGQYYLSMDRGWATMPLNSFSGSEYPVIGYFKKAAE